MRLLAAIVIALAAILAAEAGATTTDAHLNAVISIFAMRPVKVACYAKGETGNPDDIGAYGYVIRPLAKAKRMHVVGELCAAASQINNTAISQVKRATGVLTLVHEAYHLRRWSAAADEAQVECKAIRHWKVGARMLGATVETVDGLWAEALATHYAITEFIDFRTGKRPYYDASCWVPPLEEPPAEDPTRRVSRLGFVVLL